jgi:hypothetical protein
MKYYTHTQHAKCYPQQLISVNLPTVSDNSSYFSGKNDRRRLNLVILISLVQIYHFFQCRD